MRGSYISVTLFLLICSGHAQHKLLGPDRKLLPGQPGGAQPNFSQLISPHRHYLEYLQASYDIEAQQLRHPERLSGTSEDPYVTWTKTSDTFYSFNFNGITVGVTRFPPGIKNIDLLEIPRQKLTHEIHGALGLFAADLPNCTEAFWVQYVGRNDEFVTKSSRSPIKKKLPPEIDLNIPYQIQEQRGGSAYMVDSAGGFAPLGTSDEQFAAVAIPWYVKDGRISTQDVIQFTAHYHFWSYAICRKPGYHVVGHFEWGYTTRLDLNSTPYVKTDQEPIRWIPNL